MRAGGFLAAPKTLVIHHDIMMAQKFDRSHGQDGSEGPNCGSASPRLVPAWEPWYSPHLTPSIPTIEAVISKRNALIRLSVLKLILTRS